MTVNYTSHVATCGKFGCFLRLLFRWRAGIYKLVWMDLIAFLFLYYSLTLIYCFALNKEQQSTFESIVKYCDNNSLIPLSFVLGFYVFIVMTRWWAQYMAIPWPDSLAVYVSAHIQGLDERGRIFRRTVMRYVCLCLTIALGKICPHVKKRFPTWESLIDAGLLVENEKEILDKFSKKFPTIPFYWMPIVWSASIATRARREGRIRDDFALQTIVLELNKFRGNAGMLLYYDWISIPLVYTQVVTLAVYSYFACSVMAQQWIAIEDKEGFMKTTVQKYFPIFTTLEFFFYMGWLKVAETLINPFGDDDDDFEINWIIDRNLLVSYLIVDEMHNDHPELVRDQYWDEVFPTMPRYKENDRREDPFASISLQPSDTQANKFGLVSAYLTSPSKERISFDKLKTTNSSHFIIGIVPPLTHSPYSIKLPRFKKRPFRSGSVQTLNSSSSSSSSTPSLAEIQDSEDDFERLKKQREKERLQRRRNSMLKTVDNITNAVDKVTTLTSLLPPQHILITPTDSEQSSIFVDPSNELLVRQETTNTNAKARNALTGVRVHDDFERLKEERAKKRHDRMKLIIAKSLQRLDTAKVEKTKVPTIVPSENKLSRSISVKNFLQSASLARFKLSSASSHFVKLHAPSASQHHLRTDSETSSVFLDAEDSNNENTAKKPGNLTKSHSLPNIRHTKSLIDLFTLQQQSTRQDHVRVTGSTSRPWLTTRSALKLTPAKQNTGATSKVEGNSKATEQHRNNDETARSMHTAEENPPARRRVRLTQGGNILPVASETSTLYTDPDNEPSEEWHDPSKLSTQKKESKSKK